MRRVLITFSLLVFVVTACTSEPAPTEESGAPSDQPTSAPIATDSSSEAAPIGPAEEAVIKQLAENLGLQENDITLVSSEETEFGDACLGVVMEGVMCAQVVIPGRVIVLEANGLQYEYHTDEDGSRIQPATLALVWKREGGIAGFCDTLTVFRSGEVYANKCNAQEDGKMATFANLLTAKETAQFNDWILKFGEVTLDASDPKGVADRMVVTLEFFGTGRADATESDQQALFEFAQELYPKLG